MKKIEDIEEIQRLLLDILIEFHEFCDTHDLRYFLGRGTLLGAVRHGGFIPWDDDMDVFMPRPDYERLIHLTQGKWSTNLRVISMDTEGFPFPFAKVIDERIEIIEPRLLRDNKSFLFMDVFPIDGSPSDEGEANKHFYKIEKIKNFYASWILYKGSTLFKSIFKNIVHFIFKIVTDEKYFPQKLSHLLQKHSFDESEMLVVWGWGPWEKKAVVEKKSYMIPIKLEFEGELFWCPGNYDELLKQTYGDYMVLPPEEKRVWRHIAEIWWKE